MLPAGHPQNVEGGLHVDGKACRAALIGFETMAEPTVGIAIGTDSIDRTTRIGAVKQHRGKATLDQAPLTIKECPAGCKNVVGHIRQCGTSD